MPVLAAFSPHGGGPHTADLDDARESLAYWEQRAAALPRLAVRDRREARAMARRWRARVTDAERALYGSGVRGAALLMLHELRLPEPARQSARHAVRRARQAAAVLAVAVVALVVAMGVAAVALAATLLGAIS